MASRNIKLQAVESGYNRQHSTYIPADLGSGRGAGPPSLVDHHGQPILSDDLPLLHPLNRADPQDLGLEPDTVPRRCTDCIWIPPYFLGLALLVFVTQESMASAELWKLDSLPDLNGHLCGHVGSVNENKPFLFFCMDILSQFGPDSKNPRLDTYFPICVEECPDSWTTSHLCFQPGENGAIGTYAMVQDYPTIEFVGLMCRPSRSDHTTLFNQYRRFLESAPPIAMIQMLKRAWVTVMIAGLVSIAASYIFIAALGICAGLLVWSALMGVTLASFGFGIYMTWCYQQGGCGDPDSKYRDLGFGLLGFGVMFFFGTLILKLQHSLEVAIELIKASSSCVLQTPTLYLMPLLALLYRGIVAAWIAFVLLNFISAEMPLDPHLVYGDLETSGARLMWWNPWNMQLHLSYTHIAYVAFTGFMGIWTLGVISATSYFIITHGSMLWFFHDGLRGTGGAPFCAILRAYAVVFRYHLGSVISGGFFITLVAPVHGTLGVMAQMADDQEHIDMG
ncbi:unnamed protein product [Polarella glacialis]|uniref:Choline transporter-like protein n=1 Tax=Polarella glacialis TaxID=89957 RepID=A0A813F412_POLGL|nr:unnamed protein product [Polarella glacialis]